MTVLTADVRLKKLLKNKAFVSAVKRKGKWFTLGSPTTKSQAIRTGERFTRQTLGASFKVIEKGETNNLDMGGYTPNQNVFRGYKISRGQRIPLKDEWIQKRKTRLGTKSEVSEIQFARKNSIKFKGGNKKWL